jgi:hypothetical protein
MALHCFLHSCRNWRSSFASIFAFTEYRPCFQFARFERAKPLSVRGPVLVPPCIRQRPLRRAGPLQDVPFRVLTPHRGAVLGSPAGLPFFSHPRRFAWGSMIAISFSPLPRVVDSCSHRANNGLAATMYVYVLDCAMLFPVGAMLFQCFHLGRKRPQQPIGVAHINVDTLVGRGLRSICHLDLTAQ